MSNRLPTPLERLIAYKARIIEESKRQEQKLNEDFAYIHANAGSLLLSGLSSLLFPGTKTSTSQKEKGTVSTTTQRSPVTISAKDYLSIAKSLLPFAWDIAQPILMTWGIKKIQQWFTSFLFKKKKTASNN